MTFRKLFTYVCASSIVFALPGADVTVSENQTSYTLDNGIVTARVSKRSGDLTSLRYKDLELLETASGRSWGYWSHDTSRGERTTRITIDPAKNRGELGEVSVKGIANSRQMGSGPGGSVIADIEIRYALGRGDSGVYSYSIFSHPTNYPGTSLGEARFCAKLNDQIFDWMTVDANRNMQVITAYDWNHGTVMNMKEARRMNSGLYKGEVEHKYDYAANQFETPAWGWSSSEKHVGIWFVNPTIEYLSGGPTKVELSAHRDATFGTNSAAPAPPCLLNYWRSSHYGGSICVVASNEMWTKVIGPFLIYCNSGRNANAMWKDALARSAKESKAWPYDWVQDVDYPHRYERSTVSGQLVLNDPLGPGVKLDNLLVGLSAPEYTAPRIGRGGPGGGPGFSLAGGGENEAATTNDLAQSTGASDVNTNANNAAERVGVGATDRSDGRSANTTTNSATTGGRGRRGGRGGGFGGFGGFGPRTVDWQTDAKNYQFWVRGDAGGNFSIPNVRPGTYTLHAIADGVLGEFTLTNVVIKTGWPVDLGKLVWQPVRHGRQLWDIGIPNRTGSEFFKGDDYFHWGWYLEYAKLFPYDVTYVVGTSDYRKDWFFEQVPHNTNPTNTTGRGQGRSTTWSICFTLPQAPRGKATLRVAVAGSAVRNITAGLNDYSIGSVTGLVYNATIDRDGIAGTWIQRELAFDAALMRAGQNVLTLTVPAGGLTSGVIYDYLRLELDESAMPPAAVRPTATAR
jgi:rhamnogalacturonan endolyase